MPRHSKKRDVEENISDDASDAGPSLEWSDDEDDKSSDSEQNSDVGVLKQLILHGFEVKGKLVNGKLQYVFRSPKFVSNNGEMGDDQESVRSSPRTSNSTRHVTWEPEAPPRYDSSRPLLHDVPSVHHTRRASPKKNARPWIFT